MSRILLGLFSPSQESLAQFVQRTKALLAELQASGQVPLSNQSPPQPPPPQPGQLPQA